MKLYLVIPCYNEEEVLAETAKRTREKLLGLMAEGKISDESRICFVDDGSKDKTWEIIDSLCSGVFHRWAMMIMQRLAMTATRGYSVWSM